MKEQQKKNADALKTKGKELVDKFKTTSPTPYKTIMENAVEKVDKKLMEETKKELKALKEKLSAANKGSFFGIFRRESPAFKKLRVELENFIEKMDSFKTPYSFFGKLESIRDAADEYVQKRANTKDRRQRGRADVARSVSNLLSKNLDQHNGAQKTFLDEFNRTKADNRSLTEGINLILSNYNNPNIQNEAYIVLKSNIRDARDSLVELRAHEGPDVYKNNPKAVEGIKDLYAMVAAFVSCKSISGADAKDCDFRLNNLLGDRGVLAAAKQHANFPVNWNQANVASMLSFNAVKVGEMLRNEVTVEKMQGHKVEDKKVADAKENSNEKVNQNDAAKKSQEAAINATL